MEKVLVQIKSREARPLRNKKRGSGSSTSHGSTANGPIGRSSIADPNTENKPSKNNVVPTFVIPVDPNSKSWSRIKQQK